MSKSICGGHIRDMVKTPQVIAWFAHYWEIKRHLGICENDLCLSITYPSYFITSSEFIM